jgi:hypothetical protein
MNIRQAILAAADHIERNPGEFRFHSVAIPGFPSCGTPGCAIGWIASFMGMKDSQWGKAFSVGDRKNILGLTDMEFYGRMDDLTDCDWKVSPAICVIALRLYADKYHPAKPVAIPNWQAIAAQPVIADDVRSQELAHG